MAPLVASIAIFGMLEVVPGPRTRIPEGVETPFVINGAAGTIGATAVKLAEVINVHPLICIAGSGNRLCAIINRRG